MRRLPPVYPLAAALLLAGWLGSLLPPALVFPLIFIALPLLGLRRTRPFAAFLLCTALSLYRQTPPALPQHACTFTAVLTDFPHAMQPRGQRVAARIEDSPDCPTLAGQALTLFDYDQRPLTPAARLHIRAGMRINDGLTATLQDARFLAASARPVLRLRAALDTHIRARFSAAHARWMQALLIGNRSALQESDRDMLRMTGTSHLLAISGLHVALVALMAYWLGKTLWSVRRRLAIAVAPRDAAFPFMLAVAFAYVILSGAQAPALRAWLMLAGICLHWFTPRVQSGIQGLALAAAISLFLDPTMIFSLGAWLSYLATFIVLLFWRQYRGLPALRQWPLLQGWLTAALLPLSWAWFGGISLIAYFANLVVIPWLGTLLLLGFLACAHPVFVSAAQTLLAHYLAVLRFFADLPAAYLEPFWQPATLTAALAYLLTAAVLARRPRTALTLAAAVLAAALWQIRPHPALYQTPNGNAAILHTADASLIINPGYRYRERDDARRHLLPELRRRARMPAYILITQDKKRAHSALKTLLDAYPDTPVYSLVPLKNFPFDYRLCPSPPLAADCTLTLGGYRIGAQGIKPLQ